MMVTTRTGAKIGQTTWRAVVVFDNGSEVYAEEVGSREFPLRGKGLAIHFVRALLAQQKNPERPDPPVDVARYWGRVQRGTYADNSFEDPLEGFWVTDGTWEPDQKGGGDVGRIFYLNWDGTIDEGDL